MVLVGNPAVSAEDSRALKSCGDAAVEILLAQDVKLADDVAVEEKSHLKGDVERLLVELEGRGIVHLVSANVVSVELVNDLFACLEFHDGRAVVFAELGESGPHVPQHFGMIVLIVFTGRTAAKKFFLGFQLLMDFKPGLEAYLEIISFFELTVIENFWHESIM